MRFNYLKATLKTAVLAVSVLLLGAGVAVAQQQVNLTAAPTTTTMPDGTVVPMWGYTCAGATVIASSTATCAPLNPNAPVAVPAVGTTPAVPGWSPVLITVPTGQPLTINLTNSLSFTAGTGTNTVPTSIMIVGQIGGGLGNLLQRTTQPSPDHSALASSSVTWPVVPASGAFNPPQQGPRVQSFGTEVAAGTTVALTFGTPAFPLKPGTYLIESGTHPSIQGPMGLYGILVVTCAPTATAGCAVTTGTTTTTLAAGTAYPAVGTAGTPGAVPAVTYSSEVPVEFSEIDPIQNNSVNAAVTTAGFTETMVWSGQPGGCGNASSATYHQCYPPAVNFTPMYYTINGVAFNKTNAGISVFQALPASATGTVLVRMVNAGSRMHVPAIVGSLTTGQTGAGAATTVTGFQLIAEDGNPLPGTPRVQSEVFMAAGKVYDVMINAPAAGSAALPLYDRELSLSSNAVGRDSGMLAYIGSNGSGLPVAAGSGVFAAAVANPDSYASLAACTTAPCIPLTVSDPSKGVIANDVNVYGVSLLTAPTGGTLTLNANGTFTYVPNAGTTSDSFVYCANGSVSGTPAACSSGLTATASLGAATNVGGITCTAPGYAASIATYLAIKTPGVLSGCKDSAGLPLTVALSTGNAPVATGFTLLADANGGFTATVPSAGTYNFTFKAQNSLGTLSSAVTASITFPVGSGLSVKVLDGYDKTTAITDYRWVIEEDRTFYVDPNCSTNSITPIAGCPTAAAGTTAVPTLGVNFHTSYMPYVAQGCTGTLSCEGGQTIVDPATGAHSPAVCDIGNGVCRTTGTGFTPVLPSQVHLDPSKRYYISVLPGDAANPFEGQPVGHGMGGAPIGALCSPAPCTTGSYATAPVTVLSQPSPYQTAKLSVFVFEDDFPLNGEHDSGGGTGAVNTNNEPGLGQFQIHLWDAMGGNGDFTGQMSYDMFNQPLTNSLAGTIDPTTGKDACPISVNPLTSGTGATDPTASGITGMIVTCPQFENAQDALGNWIPSPLAGQAVVANLMPGRWGVIASPGADRIAKGEEWLQTNTLDGQKAHDSFTRIGEPSYFQEFGPAGYHVSIGFANPAIINARKAAVCTPGADPTLPGPYTCNNTITGQVQGERLSRTPDERLYGSGSHDTFYWTQCYVSFGDPDGEDFAFTKCNADGTFSLSGLPEGDWRVTTFDQWNDELVDGLSTPVRLAGGTTFNMGGIATTQWQANIYTRTFIDDNKDGVSQASEAGIPLINTTVRLRDGSLANNLGTDFTGTANFNEEFPLFSWYTVETDTTRYKTTGTHVVYDVGGPADGSPSCGVAGYPTCGTSTIGHTLANTYDPFPLPSNLSVPGAVYCSNADCTGSSIANGPTLSSTTNHSTGRIDPPWVGVEGWQGYTGQNNFLEFGKAPYAAATTTAPAENGGIHGHVIYASTRPFDDPQMLVQTQWVPLVPNVTINLYKEGFAADGVTPTLTLVDTTKTSSWDDWATGFRSDGVPNMNCPGQSTTDLFYYTLLNQPNSLNVYNAAHGGAAAPALPYNSQYKCYDGMHNWNQIQPAPYDGAYSFPSVTGINPTTGKPTGTNCTICIPNPTQASTPDVDNYDPYRAGQPMLPSGKYVAEVVLPPGFELVKEEDKNILIGDNFIAPVTQEFGGLGNIFILPDQAQIGSAYNPNNPQNQTQSLGAIPENSIVPGFVPEPVWPCVGESRIVPDFLSLFPNAHEVSPFAGATRNLCDRKEVTLGDQMGAIAKFYIYTSTHIASKFTGGITDDYTSEFDPFSPTFGEKFSPPDLPVSFKDWAGNEISRVYADHWGSYDGMTYSTWEVNPPNPTGYSPTMMVVCMNDPGPILDTRATIVGPTGALIPNPTLNQMITDPAYTVGYSQFCYELPFMPGTTQYLDTPVVPTSAFAGAGYDNVDCAYPDATPAVKEVDGDGIGPWVSGIGKTLTITSLGDQMVPNYAYIGPNATMAPYNAKTIKRHYGFGTTNTPGGGLAAGGVTIGGVNATVGTWNDKTITVTVPSGVPPCAVQQQTQYGGSAAQCGELVITSAASRVGGNVTGVSVTPPPAGNRGGTYAGTPPVAPTVTFAGGGGTGAAATATLGPATGSVASVTVTSGGSGYTANFNVTFTGGGGTGAHGTAVVRKKVTAVNITNLAANSYPGTGAITVTFGGAGAGGTTAVGTVTTNGGAGTAASPRRVTGVTITNAGNYAIGTTIGVTFSAPATGGTRATGNTTAAGDTSGFVASVTMTGAANSGGSGYSTSPTPVFTAGSGTGAAGTSTLSAARTATVVSVLVTNQGSGYTSAPTVTFSGSSTTRAIGTATINGPSVVVSGKQSIDTVTVTIGGKKPTHVAASASIQSAIDAAAPGDMIMVDPGYTPSATAPAGTTCAGVSATCVETTAAHSELLIMWKPVRLQGVGAASSVINANTQPAGKLDTWRQKVNCLFGLALNGSPISTGPTTNNASATGNPFDPTGVATCGSTNGTPWMYFTPFDESSTSSFNPQVDRLPLEATIGWNAELNGNLAELLQEPSLMGALEGAGVTVLSKGVNFPSNSFDSTLLAGFPTGTTLLQNTLANPNGAMCTGAIQFPSNYSCNPSSIDGLGITDSSQGGGGIFVHGWGHNLQIANNRITSNAGTLSGGINLGQGEYPPAYIQGSATNAAPGSCEESPIPNAVLPYCQNVNVDIHNNDISLNSSTGDELFSATPAGAGGVSICTGSDYYKFNYNWVCGNLSSGDGGGIGHMGFTYNGDIEHNTIVFNQSTNPTIPSNGGGILVMGTPDSDLVCNGNSTIDQDCAPYNPALPPGPNNNPGTTALSAVGPSDGAGPGLVINANLIMGNTAESGTGAGIAFQAVNGSDMVAFPTQPSQWNTVTVTNNIIADNVSGWDGAGISLVDSVAVNIINNTIVNNSSTASAGPLFNTIGAPLASQGGSNCTNPTNTATCPQVAGVVAIQNSAVLAASLPASITCPTGHPNCRTMSYPKLENDIIWHNNSYHIDVTTTPSAAVQQNIVTLVNASGSAPFNQTTTGACPAATSTSASYWDIGVRGDTGPANHSGGPAVTATDSVTSTTGGTPSFVNSYCDGSRVPPEAATGSGVTIPAAAFGWQVPPGISDATVPNPIFSLTSAATVDEGNNWVNIAFGPLSLTNPTVVGGANGNYGGGLALGNYAITAATTTRVTGTNFTDAPAYDFFDNPRKGGGGGGGGSTDAGAVRFGGTPGHSAFSLSPAAADFGLVPDHSPLTLDQDIQVINSDASPLPITSTTITATGTSAGSFTIAANVVGTVTVGIGGSGYAVGDVLNVIGGGGTGASVTVAAVDANGAITAVTLTNSGNGYINPAATITLVDATGAGTGTGATASITVYNPNTCIGTTLGAGESCVINVVFIPNGTSQAVRTGSLNVTAAGVTQTVALTGHDTIATVSVSAITPALTANPANTAAVTGTITITNTMPLTNPDAGPYIPSAIRLTRVSGAPLTDYVLGGTCAVGTPINAGGSSCTVTITYTPVAGTVGAALNGTVHLTVTGYGTASTNPIINANFNAN
jgi:hypothetical protein